MQLRVGKQAEMVDDAEREAAKSQEQGVSFIKASSRPTSHPYSWDHRKVRLINICTLARHNYLPINLAFLAISALAPVLPDPRSKSSLRFRGMMSSGVA